MIPEIVYSDDSELTEYEAEQKGWWPNIVVKIGDKRYNICIMSMLRLQQDFQFKIDRVGWYNTIPNTIIVENVVKKEIEHVIMQLYKSKYFDMLDNMGFFPNELMQ